MNLNQILQTFFLFALVSACSSSLLKSNSLNQSRDIASDQHRSCISIIQKLAEEGKLTEPSPGREKLVWDTESALEEIDIEAIFLDLEIAFDTALPKTKEVSADKKEIADELLFSVLNLDEGIDEVEIIGLHNHLKRGLKFSDESDVFNLEYLEDAEAVELINKVIRDLNYYPDFLERLGNSLLERMSLYHNKENFDEQANKLLDLINDHFSEQYRPLRPYYAFVIDDGKILRNPNVPLRELEEVTVNDVLMMRGYPEFNDLWTKTRDIDYVRRRYFHNQEFKRLTNKFESDNISDEDFEKYLSLLSKEVEFAIEESRYFRTDPLDAVSKVYPRQKIIDKYQRLANRYFSIFASNNANNDPVNIEELNQLTISINSNPTHITRVANTILDKFKEYYSMGEVPLLRNRLLSSLNNVYNNDSSLLIARAINSRENPALYRDLFGLDSDERIIFNSDNNIFDLQPITNIGFYRYLLGIKQRIDGIIDASFRDESFDMTNPISHLLTEQPYSIEFENLIKQYQEILSNKIDDPNKINSIISNINSYPVQLKEVANIIIDKLRKEHSEDVVGPISQVIIRNLNSFLNTETTLTLAQQINPAVNQSLYRTWFKLDPDGKVIFSDDSEIFNIQEFTEESVASFNRQFDNDRNVRELSAWKRQDRANRVDPYLEDAPEARTPSLLTRLNPFRRGEDIKASSDWRKTLEQVLFATRKIESDDPEKIVRFREHLFNNSNTFQLVWKMQQLGTQIKQYGIDLRGNLPREMRASLLRELNEAKKQREELVEQYRLITDALVKDFEQRFSGDPNLERERNLLIRAFNAKAHLNVLKIPSPPSLSGQIDQFINSFEASLKSKLDDFVKDTKFLNPEEKKALFEADFLEIISESFKENEIFKKFTDAQYDLKMLRQIVESEGLDEIALASRQKDIQEKTKIIEELLAPMEKMLAHTLQGIRGVLPEELHEEYAIEFINYFNFKIGQNVFSIGFMKAALSDDQLPSLLDALRISQIAKGVAEGREDSTQFLHSTFDGSNLERIDDDFIRRYENDPLPLERAQAGTQQHKDFISSVVAKWNNNDQVGVRSSRDRILKEDIEKIIKSDTDFRVYERYKEINDGLIDEYAGDSGLGDGRLLTDAELDIINSNKLKMEELSDLINQRFLIIIRELKGNIPREYRKEFISDTVRIYHNLLLGRLDYQRAGLRTPQQELRRTRLFNRLESLFIY